MSAKEQAKAITQTQAKPSRPAGPVSAEANPSSYIYMPELSAPMVARNLFDGKFSHFNWMVSAGDRTDKPLAEPHVFFRPTPVPGIHTRLTFRRVT